jgi:small subunit ribosomal protein S16
LEKIFKGEIVAVRIRLKRLGRTHRPFYRVCTMDSRTPRNGKAIEELGFYDPMVKEKDARVRLNNERIAYWLSVGAKPTEKVQVLINKYGPEGTHLEAQTEAFERLKTNKTTAPPPEALPALDPEPTVEESAADESAELADDAVEAAPATEEAAPATEEAAPATEEAAPATEEAAPATEEAAPATEEAAPATEEAVPATEEAAPATEEAAPATEEAAPATEEAAPATEEAAPATEEAAPATEEAASDD